MATIACTTWDGGGNVAVFRALAQQLGHGGIMAALHASLPIVSIPFGRDQPHNARHLEATGVGITLDQDAEGPTITAAVDAALRDDEMRTRARELAAAIQRHRDHPVERVEALLA